MLTVGEVIAMLCEHASNEDEYLMRESIYSIDVEDDDSVTVHFTDANTRDYTIRRESK